MEIGFYIGATALIIAILTWLDIKPGASARRIISSTHEDDRRAIKNVLSSSLLSDKYKSTVYFFYVAINDIYGEVWSFRSLSTSFVIAIIYSILLFLFVYIITGKSQLGGVNFFYEQPDTFIRSLRIMNVLYATFLLAFFVSYTKTIFFRTSAWISRRLIAKLVASSITNTLASRAISIILFSIGFTLLLSNFVGAGMQVFNPHFGIYTLFAFPFTIFLGLRGLNIGINATAGSLLVWAAITIAIYFMFYGYHKNITPQEVIIALLFGLIIPSANAMVDWISLGVTRVFLRRILQASAGMRGAVQMSTDIILDIGAAVLSMCLLAVLLAVTVEFANWYLSTLGPMRIDWFARIQNVAKDPFGEGLLITGMLFSTLIPTILHVVVGVAGILFTFVQHNEAVIDRIPYHPNRRYQKKLSETVQNEIFNAYLKHKYWYFISAPIALGIAVLIGTIMQQIGIPLPHLLKSLAICSTWWSHGLCF